VKVGLQLFCTDETIRPEEAATLAEERGFESLFFPEHTHIPVSRESPFPLGGEAPREYLRTYDPFVAMMAAAAASERLRIGTGICLVAQRDPIVTAKQIASVDLLGGGRVILGIGAGWNREEMENHGTDPDRRFGRMAETIEAMKAIWAEDEPSFHGKQVDFDPIWCWPKPAQRQGPPVLVGGLGPKVLDRVLRYGDGWMPTVREAGGEEELLGRAEELRRRAEDVGREVDVTINGAPAKAERLEKIAAAGPDRLVFALPSAGRGPVEERLERILSQLEQAGLGGHLGAA